MKNLFLFLFAVFFCKTLNAQSNAILDKEKLLEYYQTQRYAEAAQYLQSIYPADTQDVKMLSQIAYCNMMAGKLPEAEKNYLKINAQQPAYLPVLFSLANINSRRGNKIRAKAYLENIVTIDSTNFNAYKQLADLTTDSAELKLIYLKKANQLNPTEADIAYDLAQDYRKIKRYDSAYQVLKIAIAADTGNFILQQAQLPIANELKKYQEVVTVGEKLLQNDPDANVAKDVGIAYFFLKNYQKCISLYSELEKMAIQNEAILYYMTLSYRELKNYEMATIYAKKTIEEGISPNTATYYAMLGAIYETRNQFTSASSAYKKGLTFSASSNIYYRLGLLYDIKLDQLKNAVTYYKLYLKSKPDAKKEKEQIDYVKSRILSLKK